MDAAAANPKIRSIKEKLSFRFYFKILLISVFPTHFWALLMVFNDFEYVSERTNTWDAVGYAGYSLLFALAESLVFSLVLWLVSLAFPQKWSERRTITVLGSIYLVLAAVSIVDMLANLYNQYRISKQYLYGLENFTALTYALIFAAILITLTILLLLIFKTKKGEGFLADIFERIMLLGYFYLFLDAAGLVIVILRNVS